MRRVVGAGRSASTTVLARRRQHLLQPLADETAAANRAGEQVGVVGIVDLAVVELLELLLRSLAARHVLRVRLVFLPLDRLRAHGQNLGGPDHTELRRRVVDRFPRFSQPQRGSGRVAAARDIAVAQRRQDSRQQIAVGDECPMGFDGQIPSGQLPVAGQPVHDVGVQAAGRD